MAREHRREHATAGVIGGSTVVTGGPVQAIEGHASAGTAAPKRLRPVKAHPSMGTGNRGHAVRASQAPAAPVNANPNKQRPTPKVDASWNQKDANGRGYDAPARSLGDAVLDDGMTAVNNKIHPAERHHSTVEAKPLPRLIDAMRGDCDK